ncbi:MAG: sodium/glutamate symporter [Acidobacteria bacterium]|jgi:ESS family glutamate:Na+ symporter|nr:sodium/glutamate symporter [Acidobacteriota bacterium]
MEPIGSQFYVTFFIGCVALIVGRVLVARVRLLNAFSIPEPVVGGLLVALITLAIHLFAGYDVHFDTRRQDLFMLIFFASIGLNADLASLARGGRALAVFLAVVVGLLVTQDLLGVVLAKLLGLHPAMGLLAGSITLSGGHGTGAAWGKVFAERFGLGSAPEAAIAAATFGLILGGLIGGPVARYLLRGVKTPGHHDGEEASGFERPDEVRLITVTAVIETLALFSVCVFFGTLLASWLRGGALELPSFVCVLLVGVVLRNALAALGWYSVFDRAVSLLGNVSLALFLILALMSLRLWELGSLALPILVLLAAQATLMACYAIFVTFRVMGRNYDAAVLAAGHCGFGLGATPTAIANMQAVTDRFGRSPLAFLLVPIVGAFFLDISNAIVIKVFLMLPLG